MDTQKKVMNIEWDDEGNVELVSLHRGAWELELIVLAKSVELARSLFDAPPGKRDSLLVFDRGKAIIPELSRVWSDAVSSASLLCTRAPLTTG